MTAFLMPNGKQHYTDDAGAPLVGGKLFTWEAGTLIPKATFSDAAGTIPNTNPVIMDARGEAVIFWRGRYKIELRDSVDNVIWTVDNVSSSDESANALASDLADPNAPGHGAGMVGWRRATAYPADTVGFGLNDTPVSVTEFGPGSEVGALIQAAVNAGHRSIYIPTRANWTWTTKVVLPVLWRGRIFSDASNGNIGTRINATTGHNNPCIDAQGALFVEIDGLNVVADDSANAAPACFIVFARMLSGASSSNHRISRCIVEGPFFYCLMYNVGGEELVFENNYWAFYGSANAVGYRSACLVHTLNEESYFSGIITKEARTNGTSTSAIQHRGDVVKYQGAAGGSAIYVGPNANDILFDLTYGTTQANSSFLTLGGAFNGIRLGVDRVEGFKNSPIVSAPNDLSAGSISIFRGAYLRSGAVDAAKYAIDIAGSAASRATIYVAPDVSWASVSSGLGGEDIYLLRSLRVTNMDVSFIAGATAETLTDSRVVVTNLLASKLTMGKRANLTVTNFAYGNHLVFLYDNALSSPVHTWRGGMDCIGAPLKLHPVTSVSEGANSTATTSGNEAHIYFFNPNGLVGSIATNGTGTAYLTSSDYRAKANVRPLDGAAALAAVLSWPMYRFNWKADGAEDVGTIAHELQKLKPSAVGGELDAVFERNGVVEPLLQGVDYSKLVPELVAAIQYMARILGVK